MSKELDLIKDPQGLFNTVSQPLFVPGHDKDWNIPQFFKVIDPVSMIPIVLRIAIKILGHLNVCSGFFFKYFETILKKSNNISE